MRKRGYVVFSAVVPAVVALLILLPKQEEQPVPETVPEAASAIQTSAAEAAPQRSFRHRSDTAVRHGADPRPASPAAAVAPAPASPAGFRRTRVQLNSADTLDWQQLRGIGPVFARRIVRYRSLLGGFVGKDQLLEVYGMDSARYLSIAPYIDTDSAETEQLDINSATIDQLKRHPYLDYYQAKAIVRLREKEGAYRSVSDLRRLPVIDTETYNKILPYIKCNSQPNR